jgi:hypothetical protein
MYIIEVNDAKLHLAKGNDKMGKGIWSFATVPGNLEQAPLFKKGKVLTNGTVLEEDTRLTNVVGTCSKHCTQCAKDGCCYAWRDFKLHFNAVVKAWAENTNLLRSAKLFEAIDEFITTRNKNKPGSVATFRINTSGEIENLEQLEGWNNLAIKHPEVQFGLYTKNYEALEEFITKHGDTAENFVINVSQWKHEADSFLNKYKDKFNVFEYDGSQKEEYSEEDTERLSKLVHCPAVNKDGRHNLKPDGSRITCTDCGRCYRKTKNITAVYAH